MDRVVMWQRIEGAVLFAVGIWMFLQFGLEIQWWLAILIFFLPDLSFAGYCLGPKIGAFSYNLVHIYSFGSIFMASGLALAMPALVAVGALWLAHSGFDRMLAYGLKSTEGFTSTHLGKIGKASTT